MTNRELAVIINSTTKQQRQKQKRSTEPVLKGNSSSESKIYHIDGMNETDGDHKDQGGTVQWTDRTRRSTCDGNQT